MVEWHRRRCAEWGAHWSRKAQGRSGSRPTTVSRGPARTWASSIRSLSEAQAAAILNQRSIFIVREDQCPHPRWSYGRRVGPIDASDGFSIRQHVIIVVLPFVAGTRGRCAPSAAAASGSFQKEWDPFRRIHDGYGENLILRQLTRASTSLFPPTAGSSMTSSLGCNSFQISLVGAGQRLLNKTINFGILYQRSNASWYGQGVIVASNCPSRQRTRMSHWAGAWALNSVVSIATAPACSDFAGTAAQMKKASSDSSLAVSTFSAPLMNFSHASGRGAQARS